LVTVASTPIRPPVEPLANALAAVPPSAVVVAPISSDPAEMMTEPSA
jgi:hypothetical protein